MDSNKIPNNERLIQFLKELKEIEKQEIRLELSRMELALKQGKLLLCIKEELPHGTFLPFLKSNQVKLSCRSAERLMQLSRNEELLRNSPDLANLTLEKALALIKRKNKMNKVVSEKFVPVSNFSVASTFDSQAQAYFISLKISASDIELLKYKLNIKAINNAVSEALIMIVKNRSLTDVSTIQMN